MYCKCKASLVDKIGSLIMMLDLRESLSFAEVVRLATLKELLALLVIGE